MYNSPRRRGGSKQPADARARQVPADFHVGSYPDLLRRHERESANAARRTARERTELAGKLFRRVADSRNLRCAIDYLASEGGSAPGRNGLMLDELDNGERWELARVLSGVIRSGRYRPGPHRTARIPKGPGRGLRTLRISNVEDRVVERAIIQLVQPFLDPTFAATNFGYRPRLGREHALAYAEAMAEATGSWVWVFDDIKDAFDNVPLGRLLDVVRKRLGADDLVALIRTVIDNGTGRGIGQGSSLSPLLLNLYLDHLLDRPWARRWPANPLIRVADDLLVLATDRLEARTLHEHLRNQFRSAGMELKANPETAVRDLRNGETGDWLGFRLDKGPDGLEVHPTEHCWAKLDEHLGLAHTKPAAPIRALEIIEGWAEQLGPCRPHLDIADFHARIVSVAHGHAFDELPTRSVIEERILHGYRRWKRLRGRARDQAMEKRMAAPPARV
jgi:retron-type reverse transcriptase